MIKINSSSISNIDIITYCRNRPLKNQEPSKALLGSVLQKTVFFSLSWFLAQFGMSPELVKAEEWFESRWEKTLNYAETRELVSGHTLTIPGFGQSTYHENGAYTFAYEDQQTTQFGFFEVRNDGIVCVDFQNQSERCDVYVKDQGLLFLITEEGKRFPVSLSLEIK